MSRFLFSLAVAVVTLTLNNTAHAHGPSRSFGGTHFAVSHGGPSSQFPINRSRLSNYGTRFSHGYYFGRNNFYWNSRCWSSRYGCYCYWNPYMSCWYYWYAPQGCYYPLSYITVAPPMVAVAPAAVGGIAGPDSALPPAGPPMP